jgi:apolipoprotein N-acyltransferase
MTSILLSITSSILLILAFPQTNFHFLAWIGLVPLCLALDKKTLRQSLALSYLCGLVFFIGIVYWLHNVTIVGAILLILYLALYYGVFGGAVFYAQRLNVFMRVVFLSSVWVLLEVVRHYLVSGFGWGSLGQSQAFVPLMIQIADITGMYGVSFIIVFINIGVSEIILDRKDQRHSLMNVCSLIVISVVLLTSVCVYGVWRIKTLEFKDSVSIGVVQGNIPQEDKWRAYLWPSIMQKQLSLTDDLIKQGKPDLIVWPETSYPGVLWDDINLYQDLITAVKRYDTPLLFGSAVLEGGDYFNVSMLIDGKGTYQEQYQKLHLVPFGEYVPLRNVFPILTDILPIGDFKPGKEATVFTLSDKNPVRFSTPICFEDTVAHLSSDFVRNGAQILINITNDAWFADTKAPFLHLAAAIFRSVENRRSLVRAANTGVSAFIDPLGRVVAYVQDDVGKKIFISGFHQENVPISDEETVYGKFPQFFIYFCLVCMISTVLYSYIRLKEK